jgi:hypothetical protein
MEQSQAGVFCVPKVFCQEVPLKHAATLAAGAGAPTHLHTLTHLPARDS